ncbi:Aminotransferase-like, plant mobile domain family protein, partial [Prunus dulcis]
YDMEMYKNKNKVVKLFGKPIADLLAGERRVPYDSLCTPYWNKHPKDDKEADQIARAFILCLIGSSFLNDKSHYVSMHYAPVWKKCPTLVIMTGGGGFGACTDRWILVRGAGQQAWAGIGGHGRLVWACEYLKPFALSSPSGSVNTWPRTLRWVGAKSKRDLQHHLEPFRVMMRHLTTDQVNWNPWGTNDSELPEEVQKTVPATRNESSLRDQLVQHGTPSPQVPKIPPRTMLADYKLTNESEVEEAVNGYPASEWVAPRSSDYADYRDEYIRYRHYDDLRDAEPQHSTPAGANVLPRISPQPWLVRIPCWANQNGSKVVQIPRGQDCCVIPLPDGVTHVTAEAATELMELNAGLNAVLFSTALEASIEIRRLREENERLKHTSGTGIASSGLAEDVVDDDAEHEFRTKMQHDTRRKGKTKVVLPQEHEEDAEEEEQEEGEEEEEEDQEQDEEEEEEDQEQDESWMDEKEDESEDEEEDGHEEGATSKGKPDANNTPQKKIARVRKVFVHVTQRERKRSKLRI